MIRYPIKGKLLCTTRRAVITMILVGIFCLLITLPTLFEWTIVTNHDGTITRQNTEFGMNPTYVSFYYWFSAITFVFVPLSILSIFNLFLIRSVRKSSQKRREWIADLRSSSVQPKFGSCTIDRSSVTSTSETGRPRSLIRFMMNSKINLNLSLNQKKSSLLSTTNNRANRILLRQDSHITRLLVAVVLFFLICQLPSALVIIYNASINGKPSPKQVIILQILGNIFNLLVAINSAGNFALYCLLSRKYRLTLMKLIYKVRC